MDKATCERLEKYFALTDELREKGYTTRGYDSIYHPTKCYYSNGEKKCYLDLKEPRIVYL